MAITLTQNWQVVAEHRWQPSTGFDFSMYLEARYTEQNTSTNSTKILTRLRSVVNKGQGSGYGYGFNCSYCSSISGTGQWFFGTETILESSEQTIYHENDGSKSLTLYASGYVNGVSYSFDINGVINFPKIDRLPIITSLTNQITDEDNIVLKFDNPGGFYIKAYFYRLSGYDFSRENITSPYTFELTDEERNAVRQFMKNMTVDKNASFTIEAYSSSDFSESSYIGEASTTMQVTIKDANPTITLTVTETNQKVIDLYGTNNASTVVKNLSQLKLVSTVGLKKYATLKSRTYTYNSNQISSATTVTIVPTVNKVSVKAVDSRTLSASASKTLNMVDYLPMVINSYDFFRTSPTSSEIKLSADLTYFQGTYNGIANAPVIQYKMGANGTLRTLTTDDYTLDTANKKITITNLVLTDTLAYTKAETFYLYVSDIFTSDTENVVVLKGVPTFEAGETDFQVNGTMYLANESGEKERKLNLSANISNNLFDKSTITTGDIIADSPTIRLSSRQELWLEVGTYTFSSNLSSPFRYAIQIQSTGVPPLVSYPTYILSSGWKDASEKVFTFTIEKAGYFMLLLSKTDNATLTVDEALDYDYQLEVGQNASELTDYFEPSLFARDDNGSFRKVFGTDLKLNLPVVARVGSNEGSSSGWYKVASQTMSGYANTNLLYYIKAGYSKGYYGLLELEMRCSNTSIAVWTCEWIAKSGFAKDDIRIVIDGMTWTMYVKNPSGQYGRVYFSEVQNKNIDGAKNAYKITYYNSAKKESTTPTASYTTTSLTTSQKILFTGGTINDVTLSETSANFDYIEIFYHKGDGCASVKVPKANYASISLVTSIMIGNAVQTLTKVVKISGTTISVLGYGVVNNEGTGMAVYISNEIQISKVIGYKE